MNETEYIKLLERSLEQKDEHYIDLYGLYERLEAQYAQLSALFDRSQELLDQVLDEPVEGERLTVH